MSPIPSTFYKEQLCEVIRNNDASQFANSVHQFRNFLASNCIFCYFKDDARYNKHMSKECMIFNNKCKKCLNCGSRNMNQCSRKILLPNGNCYKCCLPFRLNGEIIHESVANGVTCQYEDAIYPFCWMIFDDRATRIDMQRKLNDLFQQSTPVTFTLAHDYQVFLKDKVNGVLGCVIIAMLMWSTCNV